MPLYLGFLFYRLDECVSNIVQLLDAHWERLGMVSPKLHKSPVVEMVETAVRRVKTGKDTNVYTSRALRWANIQ